MTIAARLVLRRWRPWRCAKPNDVAKLQRRSAIDARRRGRRRLRRARPRSVTTRARQARQRRCRRIAARDRCTAARRAATTRSASDAQVDARSRRCSPRRPPSRSSVDKAARRAAHGRARGGSSTRRARCCVETRRDRRARRRCATVRRDRHGSRAPKLTSRSATHRSAVTALCSGHEDPGAAEGHPPQLPRVRPGDDPADHSRGARRARAASRSAARSSSRTSSRRARCSRTRTRGPSSARACCARCATSAATAMTELAAGERCGITVPTRVAFRESGWDAMLEQHRRQEVPLRGGAAGRDPADAREPAARLPVHARAGRARRLLRQLPEVQGAPVDDGDVLAARTTSASRTIAIA